MANITDARKAVIERALSGDGRASRQMRKAAFDQQDVPDSVRALLAKVANHPYKVSDEDIAAAKAAGISEDELFELAVCAALGQASRQHDHALAALAAATKDS
jgi:hypothetical protein